MRSPARGSKPTCEYSGLTCVTAAKALQGAFTWQGAEGTAALPTAEPVCTKAGPSLKGTAVKNLGPVRGLVLVCTPSPGPFIQRLFMWVFA